MKSFPKLVISTLLTYVLVLTAPIPSMGQSTPDTQKPTSKDTVTKGVKGQGSAESDPNIKGKTADNDPNSKIPPPPGKGVATRGSNPWPCKVNVDNRTGLKIQIYVDGDYSGLSSPWGDAYMLTGSGTTNFYALASFLDGSKVTWGPWNFNCPALGTYTWSLVAP